MDKILHDMGLLESPVNEEIHVYDNLEFVYGANVQLPSKFSLTPAPIRDQAYSSWCVSFSTSEMQYCDDLVKYGKAEPLSQEFIHKHCKDIDGIPTALGTTLEAACKVITSKGACLESSLPFDRIRSQDNKFTTITEDMKKEALKHKSKSYARVSTLQKVKEAIYKENGVLIGLKVFENFHTDKGYIPEPPHALNTTVKNRHCMFVCGWDDNHVAMIDGKEHKGFLKIQESYGTEKGSYGYRFLAYDFWDSYAYYSVDKLVSDCWCTYDPDNLTNPNYHTDRFKPTDEAIKVKTKEIVLTLGSNKGTIDGKEITLRQVPEVVNGTTFVPIRQISELFGCSVSWDPEEKRVSVSDLKRKIYIKLYLNKKEATSSLLKQPYILLEAPYSKNGTTMVPIRAVSELLKYVVRYDSKTKKITIIA